MRGPCRCTDDARCHRLASVKELDVNTPGSETRTCERLFHVGHETSRPAKVDIRFSWDANLIENRSRQVTGSVEVFADPVVWSRSAVTNINAAVRERGHETSDFSGERMMLAIASCMKPQDLPRG